MSSDRGKQEFPENIQTRAVTGTREAIWKAANLQHTSPSTLLRQWIHRGLEEAGVVIDRETAA